jgi:hypothetical protein
MMFRRGDRPGSDGDPEAGRDDPDSDPDLVDLPAVPDWTMTESDKVAPWRRSDRARLDRARAIVQRGLPEQLRREASDHAREIRRLADLHGDGALSNEELVAAVRAVLFEPGGERDR